MTPEFARARRIASKAAHTAVLIFFVTFLAFPFYWMVITAFKTNQDLYDTHNNPYLFNSSPTLRQLSLLFEDTQYLQWLLNTGFVGVVVVVITLLLSCAGRCLFLGLDDGGLPDCKRPNRNYL